MRHYYFKSLLTVLLAFSASMVYADECDIDGIHYVLHYTDMYTAGVAYVKDPDFHTNFSYKTIYKGDIVIPETFTYKDHTYTVTAITFHAFDGGSEITSVTLPKTIIKIEDYAFKNCSQLKTLEVPDGVISIGEQAFTSCSELTHMTLPDGIYSIGKSAFASCTKLESINIPTNCSSIYDATFYHCDSLKSIVIPNKITNIGNRVFTSCTELRKLVFEDGEKTLKLGYGEYYKSSGKGEGLFSWSPIDSVYLGRNLEFETVPNSAYSPFYQEYRKDTISSVVIGPMVTQIFDRTFTFRPIKSLVMSASVKKVGSQAFPYVNKLSFPNIECMCDIEYTNFFFSNLDTLVIDGEVDNSSIVIPETVRTIKAYAFSDMPIDTITLPKTIRSIGAGALMMAGENAILISEIEEPFPVDESAFKCGKFSYDNYLKNKMHSGKLFVPKGTKEKYENTEGWMKFKGYIYEGTPANVAETSVSNDEKEPTYTLTGVAAPKPKKGSVYVSKGKTFVVN